MEFLLAAITLGFFGSFHCIGMCGPIALALPVHGAGPFKKTMLIISYNFGRILTYSVFGVFAGMVGKSFVMAGYQQLLSVLIGLVLLLGVFLPMNYKKGYARRFPIFAFFNKLKTQLGKLFLKNGHGPLFLIGLLNGLLPCGLVYIGIAGAIATGDILKGSIFMAVFGFGTLPVMISLPLIGGFITVGTRARIRRSIPVVVSVMAILLILRGLNLGIPYVSPKLEKQGSMVSCHAILPGIQPHNKIKCMGANTLYIK